jgi:hypothetical protein
LISDFILLQHFEKSFIKSLPTSLCKREEVGFSHFGKGGLRGIL